MPWCDECDRYLAPNTVSTEGTCPTCDGEIDATDVEQPAPVQAPWHFWVMVAALVAYLGWRVIQAFIWAAERF